MTRYIQQTKTQGEIQIQNSKNKIKNEKIKIYSKDQCVSGHNKEQKENYLQY